MLRRSTRNMPSLSHCRRPLQPQSRPQGKGDRERDVQFGLPFAGSRPTPPPRHFRSSGAQGAPDVSWAAFVETRTIMLTGDGTLEALDVKADDLAEALSLDRRNSGLQLT